MSRRSIQNTNQQLSFCSFVYDKYGLASSFRRWKSPNTFPNNWDRLVTYLTNITAL